MKIKFSLLVGIAVLLGAIQAQATIATPLPMITNLDGTVIPDPVAVKVAQESALAKEKAFVATQPKETSMVTYLKRISSYDTIKNFFTPRDWAKFWAIIALSFGASVIVVRFVRQMRTNSKTGANEHALGLPRLRRHPFFFF